MAAVEIRDLTVRYGDVTAVDALSLSADAGEVLAVLGPNGAGKTTTVETAEGYRRPSSGSVRVLGLDPAGDRAALTPKLGVMLQAGGVYPSMGARSALRLFASYYDDAEDPEVLLDRLDLKRVAASPWRQLSGGEQQRVSLALALVGKPEVAFLDEPTAGVDPTGRLRIREIVAELRDAGVCVVVTTHDLDEAERMADRVAIVDQGRLLAEGTPASLRAGGAPDETRFAAPPGIDVASLSAAIGAAVSEVRLGEYVVAAAGSPALVAALTSWLARHDVALADLRAGRQSLEDVFLRLTAESSSAAREEATSPRGRRRARR